MPADAGILESSYPFAGEVKKPMVPRCLLSLFMFSVMAWAAEPWRAPSNQQIDAIYPQVETLYLDLHRNPELSYHEEKTAATIAAQLRQLGYDVTTGVGGTGVVGVLKNGPGPTVMLRAELDALPVPEKTGLPYASRATTHDDRGVEVPVMHACGHDLHMAIGIGTAALLAQNKDRWHGTFIYVGQPAEERIGGARAMIERRPVHPLSRSRILRLPSTTPTSFRPEKSATRPASSRRTRLCGRHHLRRRRARVAPATTVDPIVLAARTIVSWQTIVARKTIPPGSCRCYRGLDPRRHQAQHHPR